jgi:hypothetical protein
VCNDSEFPKTFHPTNDKAWIRIFGATDAGPDLSDCELVDFIDLNHVRRVAIDN